MNKEKYLYISNIFSILINIFLTLIKIIVGNMTNSISLISDGFNNFTDSISNLIYILATFLSNKKPDKEHPYGHGRYEYIATFVAAFIIFNLSFSMLKLGFTSSKILDINKILLIVIFVSITFKIFIIVFNYYIKSKIKSGIIDAVIVDAIVDIVINIVMLISFYVKIKYIDNILAIIIALLIAKTGFEILKESIDSLLGTSDFEVEENNIIKLFDGYEYLNNPHKILFHNYGKIKFATIHIDVPAYRSIIEIHNQIDEIEKKAYDLYNIKLVTHIDPIDEENSPMYIAKVRLDDCIKEIDSSVLIDELKVEILDGGKYLLKFDMYFPYGLKYDYENSIKNKLIDSMKLKYNEYEFDVHIHHIV